MNKDIWDVKIDWMFNLGNTPDIVVKISPTVLFKDFVFEQMGSLYLGKYGPWRQTFSTAGGNDGFGGASFLLRMKDGTEKRITGPWSSRPSVFNGYLPEREHFTDVTTMCAGCPGLLINAIKLPTGAFFVKNIEWENEVRYLVSKLPHRYTKQL